MLKSRGLRYHLFKKISHDDGDNDSDNSNKTNTDKDGG